MIGILRWFLTLPYRLFRNILRSLIFPNQRRALTATEAAKTHIKELEAKVGTTHIPLTAVSYETALAQAKKDLRFLLVILTSEIHDDTPAMYQLICDETLRSYVIENDISVWAGNVAEREAYAVSVSLGATRFPFIAVIVYSTVPRTRMACVATIEGTPQVIDLMSTLAQLIETYGPTLVSLRADRAEQTFSRVIRAEQDSAYEVSLRKDREAAERERMAQLEKKAAEEAAAKRLTDRTRWRRWNAAHILPEPDTNVKNASRISFRMPLGSRCVRKFASHASIKDVYIWVDLQLHTEDDSSILITGDSEGLPIDYEHTYDFTLAVPMPRRILTASEERLDEHKELFPSGSLVIEMLPQEGGEDEKV